MIIELGHFALILAFGVAILQSTLPMIGAAQNRTGWMAVAEPAAIKQFVLVAFSFAALTYGFVSSDFSLKVVVAGGTGFLGSALISQLTADGHDVTSRTSDQLADLRARTIGFVFQTFNLLPVLSAAENVEYPLLQLKSLSKASRQERSGRRSSQLAASSSATVEASARTGWSTNSARSRLR